MACHPEQPFTAEQEARIREIAIEACVAFGREQAKAAGERMRRDYHNALRERGMAVPSAD